MTYSIICNCGSCINRTFWLEEAKQCIVLLFRQALTHCDCFCLVWRCANRSTLGPWRFLNSLACWLCDAKTSSVWFRYRFKVDNFILNRSPRLEIGNRLIIFIAVRSFLTRYNARSKWTSVDFLPVLARGCNWCLVNYDQISQLWFFDELVCFLREYENLVCWYLEICKYFLTATFNVTCDSFTCKL